MSDLADIIPGLGKAIERERFVRDQSFLEFAPVVCGIEIKPLTLRRFLLLSSIGSPFVEGGAADGYDIASFFIVMTGKSRGLSRWLLLRKIGKLNCEDALKEIKAFLEESFMDSPASSGGEVVSYYSLAAGLIDFLASEYGWTENEVMDSKFVSIFQYLKAAKKRLNPSAILFNPSDRVKGRWLEDVNAGRIKLN
ncbi:MAG: hypothetical protein QM813_26400 [Verrucomicrobiota bacterium]